MTKKLTQRERGGGFMRVGSALLAVACILALGCAVIFLVGVELSSGVANASRSHKIHVDRDPSGYWFVVGFHRVGGGAIVAYAIWELVKFLRGK